MMRCDKGRLLCQLQVLDRELTNLTGYTAKMWTGGNITSVLEVYGPVVLKYAVCKSDSFYVCPLFSQGKFLFCMCAIVTEKLQKMINKF